MGWADSYIRDLREGKAVTFRPRGNSMGKHIPSGTLVRVEPLSGEVIPGSIVLCKVKGSQYLHFASAIKGDQVRIENAHGFVNGWTALKNVYGVLVAKGDEA